MDNTENLTKKEINELIDSLNSYKPSEDTISITSDIFNISSLPDYNFGMATSSQSTAIPSLGSSSYGINIVPNTISINNSINQNYSSINQNYNWQNNQNTWLESTLRVGGDADIQGDIKLQGKSLKNILECIENRLAILHPNKDLEDKWEELKELGEKYRELELEIIAKEEMFKTLKN